MAADDWDTAPLSDTVAPLAPRWVVEQYLWTSGIFCVLVAVWTFLRVYARQMRHVPLTETEDILYYVSVISFYAFIVAMYILVFFGGAGYHIWQLQWYHIDRLTESLLAMQGLYGLCMCTIKWSMLWTLKRIFLTRSFTIIVWCIVALQAAWLVMTLLIGFLVCRPIEKNWDPTVEGECGDQTAAYTAVSAVNVAIDIIMCVMPIPMVYRLQIRKSYKTALLGVFSLGIITIIFAIIRLLALRDINFDDFSWTIVTSLTWTCAESGIVILVASSFMMRPILDRVLSPFLSGISRASGRGASSGRAGARGASSGGGSSSRPVVSSFYSRKKRGASQAGFVTVDDEEDDVYDEEHQRNRSPPPPVPLSSRHRSDTGRTRGQQSESGTSLELRNFSPHQPGFAECTTNNAGGHKKNKASAATAVSVKEVGRGGSDEGDGYHDDDDEVRLAGGVSSRAGTPSTPPRMKILVEKEILQTRQ